MSWWQWIAVGYMVCGLVLVWAVWWDCAPFCDWCEGRCEFEGRE